ncbi:30S ribosomal protein S6 [Candidatus Woesebacteria bacterium]|nr:MAG: 30S ribosomal protein S6 [Candidatus Woesebacteria bacterium]
MNTYELTLILPGSTTPAKKKAIIADIESLVKVNKGVLKETEDWGNIDLAYQISGNRVGSFIHFKLDLDSQAVSIVDNKVLLNEEIIRHLLVKASKEK